jgi:N-acetyl-gamma-glutamyl-phosphate reductase common form
MAATLSASDRGHGRSHMSRRASVGIVGARGYVGAELIALVAQHPALELGFVASRELAGTSVADQVGAYRGALCYVAPDVEAIAAAGADVVVLALPNGKAAPYVAAIERSAPATLLLDLSADHRFDDAWFYGLPELYRQRYRGQRRISNPGCYATAMQLALAPMLPLLDGPAQCFGVSGYSGAGTSPSDKNDPEKLRDNLIPYALAGHVHEREVTRRLGHPVEFMPHVAPHFRGITMTVSMHLRESLDLDAVLEDYRAAYAAEPLLRVVEGAPWVSAIAGRHDAEIGGFTLADDGRRLVAVATLDNLLKGAATQALQNINLALDLAETTGIPR